ncbi:hypothetical protein LguiA_028148 [Lonicera macranthoides]
MSQKRQQDDTNTSDDKRQKVPSLKNVVLEVMRVNAAQNFLEPVLEPLIRKVRVSVCKQSNYSLMFDVGVQVKEEVELSLRKYMTSMKWNIGKEIEPSESRSLQLQFLNTLALPVFTGTRIEGEECTTLKVALFDAFTGQVVSFGPESSAKVEIVVLEGDFDGDERNYWTLEEFKNNIVREREGKKPLLTGELFFDLKEGIGLVGEISFTDNSSWTRSRKFRLGARVVDNCDGVRVKEAKSDSFVVRDHRGELYKKHHPPSLFDEVWRLEKIGKEGAFHKRLSRENIKTVQDFLTLLFLDPAKLRNILGTGMSNKMWEVTVEHAKTCVLDKRRYLYCPPSQQMTHVVFNAVGQVMGLFSNGQYVPTDKLSDPEKARFSHPLKLADAHNLVICAYKDWTEVVPFEDDASLIDSSSPMSNVVFTSNSPTTGSSDNTKVLTTHNIDSFDYPQLNPSSPNIFMGCVDDYGLNSIDSMDVQFDQSLSFGGQLANSMVCDGDSVIQGFSENEHHLQYFDDIPSLESQADLQSAVSGFLLAHSTAATKKAQRRWTVLFRVLRWSSMLRKLVRKAHLRGKPRYH